METSRASRIGGILSYNPELTGLFFNEGGMAALLPSPARLGFLPILNGQRAQVVIRQSATSLGW